MSEGRRSAVVEIPFPIELPKRPLMHVIGRGTDGQVVCHVYLNAAGLSIHGPGEVEIADLNWDTLIELAKQRQH